MGMLVVLTVVAVAAVIILILAIRMAYHDDKRSRQLPRALPMGQRVIRWDDDMVDIEGAAGMRERIWWKKLGFGLGKEGRKGNGKEEGFSDAILRVSIEEEADEEVEPVQWRIPRW